MIILQKVLVDSAVQSIVTLAVSMLCVHVYLLWRRKSWSITWHCARVNIMDYASW